MEESHGLLREQFGNHAGHNSKENTMSHPDLSILAARWPSPLVAREKVSEFSGGIVTPKTLANLDSIGEGPKGRIICGRKIAYPVDQLVTWLESRSRLAPEVRG
jgi:hypothetical protein